MPGWAITFATIITLIIILGGALSFPYVPMFFGVYGAERHSARGKLIYKLIWLFPPIAVLFLYLAWTGNGLLALAPFVYIAVVWMLRPNKGDSSGPGMQYSNSQQNLDARLAEIDYRWNSWQNIQTTNYYLLLNLFASSTDAADNIKQALAKSEQLHSAIEISSYDNNTATVYARVKLDAIDKDVITAIVRRVIDLAWNTHCELSSVDIMEEEE